MGTTPSGEADNIDLAPSVCGDHTSEINTRQRWCSRHTHQCRIMDIWRGERVGKEGEGWEGRGGGKEERERREGWEKGGEERKKRKGKRGGKGEGEGEERGEEGREGRGERERRRERGESMTHQQEEQPQWCQHQDGESRGDSLGGAFVRDTEKMLHVKMT